MSEYKRQKKFVIFPQDSGIEAYEDAYVHWLERSIERLKHACLREASKQSHAGHAVCEPAHAITCPECLRAMKLRRQADDILNEKGT